MRASIVIASHNEGDALWRTVRACVETCAGLDYEVVVADDASTDGSLDEALRRFPRVRVARHEARQGTSPTKDLAARSARGDVLVFLDGHCNPEPGAVIRLVRDVEALQGQAVVTPTVASLDVRRWRNAPWQVGHGYFVDLEQFDCGWLPLSELRAVEEGAARFYESPALIGCAFAVGRELYEDLWGFDPDMRVWGVEDLDFGLKCWLMGHRILHDPDAVVGHRFRASFDSYAVPAEHFVANQLRMARKHFTHGAWADWVDRCRRRHPGRLADRPEGAWARIWQVFEERRPSAEQERAHLHARRVRDEFWYAERFGLTWPRLHSAPMAAIAAPFGALALQPSPSPSPGPSPSPPPDCGTSEDCKKAGSLMKKSLWYRWDKVATKSHPMNWEGPDAGPWTVNTDHDKKLRELYSIFTHCCYSDFHLSLEFWLNKNRKDTNPEDWANSGVYVFFLYEVQILDTTKGAPPKDIGQGQGDTITLTGDPGDRTLPTNKACGALYKLLPPAKNWAKASEEWQTMDIYFMAARFKKVGEKWVKVKDATIKVYLNSSTDPVVDRVGLPRGTGQQAVKDETSNDGFVRLVDAGGGLMKQAGPIRIQEHDNPLKFRNITIDPTWTQADWQRDALLTVPTATPNSGKTGTTVDVTVKSDDIQKLKDAGDFTVWLITGPDNWNPNAPTGAETSPVKATDVVVAVDGKSATCKFKLKTDAGVNKKTGKWRLELAGTGYPRAVVNVEGFTVTE